MNLALAAVSRSLNCDNYLDHLFNRLNEMNHMSKHEPELILTLGCEGGEFNVYKSLNAHGETNYFTKERASREFGLAAFDDEGLPRPKRQRRRQPRYRSLGDALNNAIGGDNLWACFCPVRVNPKFHAEVLELRREVLATASERRREDAACLEDIWQKGGFVGWGEATEDQQLDGLGPKSLLPESQTEQPLSENELQFVREFEKAHGREMSPQEIRLGIQQLREIGE